LGRTKKCRLTVFALHTLFLVGYLSYLVYLDIN